MHSLVHQFLNAFPISGRSGRQVDRAILRDQNIIFDTDTNIPPFGVTGAVLRNVDTGLYCNDHIRLQIL